MEVICSVVVKFTWDGKDPQFGGEEAQIPRSVIIHCKNLSDKTCALIHSATPLWKISTTQKKFFFFLI